MMKGRQGEALKPGSSICHKKCSAIKNEFVYVSNVCDFLHTVKQQIPPQVWNDQILEVKGQVTAALHSSLLMFDGPKVCSGDFM